VMGYARRIVERGPNIEVRTITTGTR
jgi:hypothetical protein